MKKIHLIILFMTLVSFIISCGRDNTGMKDKAGNQYKTIKIGNQVWMAENLNYETEFGSWSNENDTLYSKKYGRLYTWETACTVCPEGWHLPSVEEWEQLIDFLSKSNLGNKEDLILSLMSGKGWNLVSNNTGSANNSSGFSALPGGYRYYDGKFYNIGKMGIWWSSSKLPISEDVYRCVYYINNKNIEQDFVSGWYGASVRCIKDSI
jgi:uncharacterized protein (TIGR02145 family)